MMSELSNPTLLGDRLEIVPFSGGAGAGVLAASLDNSALDEASRTPVGVLALTIFSFGLGLSVACFWMVWYIATV